MQKSDPLTSPASSSMVVFALSCFGLLLFLWLSSAARCRSSRRATACRSTSRRRRSSAIEADVRVAGVSVGKVRKVEVDPTAPTARSRRSRSSASTRRCAPDARAILRQKTLLGETYVELTPGTLGADDPRGRPAAERAGASRPSSSTRSSDSLDPATRAAFRGWQQELAKGINGPRARLQRRARHAARLRAATAPTCSPCSTRRRARCTRLVKNTGVVFGALTENEAAAAQPDHVGSRAYVRRHRVAAGRRWPRRSGSSRPSSTSRRRTLARAADVLDQHRSAGPRPAAGRAATSSRRCATCARWRPTSSASSATSTR